MARRALRGYAAGGLEFSGAAVMIRGKLATMPYALLQNRLEIPDVEALRRAFKGVGGMAPSDAPHVARDAFGILLKQLSLDDALTLQASLEREGVGTDVVDHAELGEFPEGRRIRRIAVRAEGFVACDPYDREFVIPWDSLRIVSCGLVLETEIVRPSGSIGGPAGLMDLQWEGGPFPGWSRGADLNDLSAGGILKPSTERQSWKWTADLVLRGGDLRFQFSPDRLFFLDSDRPATGSAETDFLEVVRSVASNSPKAALNRVAFALREGAAETLSYPSRNAYQEELIWLRWRLRRAGRID